MDATTINTTASNTNTYNAGISSPHPSEAHQRAGEKGQKRVKAMNGSWLHMEYNGMEWVIYHVVTGAPFVKTASNTQAI